MMYLKEKDNKTFEISLRKFLEEMPTQMKFIMKKFLRKMTFESDFEEGESSHLVKSRLGGHWRILKSLMELRDKFCGEFLNELMQHRNI